MARDLTRLFGAVNGRREREDVGSAYIAAGSTRELARLYDALVRAQDGDEDAQAEASRLTRKLWRRFELGGPQTASDRRELERERKRLQRRRPVVSRNVEPSRSERTPESPASTTTPSTSESPESTRPARLLPRSGSLVRVPAHVWRSKRSRSDSIWDREW